MQVQPDYSLYRLEPSESDIERANCEISSHERAIASLDVQTNELFIQVQRLHAAKAKHKAAISRCKGVMTLARRIPPEILIKIFEICVFDGWTPAPLVVSQVCSTWRNAAKSPFVWSHIYVDCEKGDPVSKVVLWLNMAQRSPLHVIIRANQYHPTVGAVLDLLLDRVAAWRSFKLEVPSAHSASLILSRCNVSVPQLAKLHIVMSENAGDPIDLAAFLGGEQITGLRNAFRRAPKLSEIHLTSSVLQPMAGIPPQVTSLSIHLSLCQVSQARPVLALDLLTTLEDLPLLREFSLVIPRRDAREFLLDDPSHIVTLANLTSLTLDIPSPFMAVLQHLRAPSLVNLHLRCPDDSACYADDATRAAIRTFISESSPLLRLFELYDIDISQDDFLFCFTALPTLITLRLHGSEILDSTIEALHGPDGFCPNLSTLDLRWCGHLTGSALMGLVQSRKIPEDGDNNSASRSKISELTVINCSFVDEAHILEITNLAICRLYLGDSHDYCRLRGCCENVRYRQRFQLRHTRYLTPEQQANIKLN